MTPDVLPAYMQQRIVVTDSGCWQWTASFDRGGYGRASMSVPDTTRRRWAAHRIAYRLTVGPVPERLQLDHLCRNRACVNPTHLEPVTAQENNRRSTATANRLAKTHCPRSHAYDEANTQIQVSGSRRCRACAREKARERRAAKRTVSAVPSHPTTSKETSMSDQNLELLAEAVRRLHTQAHSGPSDAIYAERCRRDPCDTVGSLLDIATGDVKGQFSIQQAS